MVKIGVLGTGCIGSDLIRKFSKAGHDVRMANSRGPESLAELAKETGAKAVTVDDVVKDVDLVVVTIPLKAIMQLPKGLFEKARPETFILDTCNYYPARDGAIQEIDAGEVESVWVSRQLGKPVVKAFNSIFYKALEEGALPKGSPGRLALPIAGDEDAAKALVAKLIDEIGFDPYDVGPLAESWRQQPGSPCYCTNLDITLLPVAIKQTSRELLPGRRDESLKKTIGRLSDPWRELGKIMRQECDAPTSA